MSPSSGAVPTTSRLAPKRLGLAAAIVGALLTGMVLMSLLQRQRAVEQPAAPPLPPIYEVQGAGDGFQQLHLKTSWAGEDRTPPKPPAVPAAPPVLPPPPLFPPSTQTAALIPTPMAPPPLARTIETPPLAPPPMVQGPSAAVMPEPVKVAPVKSTPTASPGQKEDNEWLFADVKGNPKKRQGNAPGPDGGPGAARGGQSSLFPAAQWERPAQPLKVIYQSQLLHAIVEGGIVTGEDSDVRLRLVQTLFDKFGQETVLLPHGTMLLGKAQGQVKRGQSRIAIGLTKAELPDGTDITLTGKVGDHTGRVGVPGDVDNKYGQVALSAVLTAVLSVGSRAAAGSTTGFNPTLEQEFSRDIGQSANASGQKIVERMLDVQPEISVPPMVPVTVQLNQSYSLQSGPKIVYK